MKLKRLRHLRPITLVAVGVFLGRGAQADTTLDFDSVPPEQPVNAAPGVLQTFGDNAASSSDGVSVAGFGTPNVDLAWQATALGDARWDYYNDGGAVWSAAQLNNSAIGVTHSVSFTPNSAAASVIIKSFNFHPYYVSTERFSYEVSVLAGSTVVTGTNLVTFISDATKAHPVSINYTGAPGQTLILRLARVASTLSGDEVEGDPYDIAVDDIKFGQLPETVLSSGPQVLLVSPSAGQTGVAATSYPYFASITNGSSTLVATSIKLELDDSPVSPPPTITSADGLTNVSYSATNLLASGSTHSYKLTYADSLSVSYTNEVVFTVANYPTLPPAYGSPPGSGSAPGFTFRTVAASQDTTNVLDSTIARAKEQLNGTLIDPSTSAPYTNVATLGTNADSSFDIDTVLNFSDGGSSAGNFPDDVPFPGLEGGPYDWFSTEAFLNVDLAVGYYRFGVNSDDGFEVSVIPPLGVSGSPVVLGRFDDGRAAEDTLFDFYVQTAGIYRFQLVYFESTGSASLEFFSVTNIATGGKLLINDPDPNAIKSFRVLAQSTLRIVSIAQSGTNVVLSWAFGTPPFQVQSATNLINPVWSDIGLPTTDRTATAPIGPGMGFFRIAGQP